MDNEKKPLVWMILFGIVRHALFGIGVWMEAKGWIDTTTKDRLVSEGAAQIAGYILMVIPLIWSILQKKQAWGWVITALRLGSKTTSPGDIPVISPGPDQPL